MKLYVPDKALPNDCIGHIPLGGLSGMRIGHVSDEATLNRGPEFGSIDRVVCRNATNDVRWPNPD